MRILAVLWNHFVSKKSGYGHLYSTKDRTYSVARFVFGRPAVRMLTYNPTKWFGLISAVSILCFSCGSVKTPPDAAPPYVETDFHSVEADFCGVHYFGVGGCSLPVGTGTSKISLAIQGFLTGEVAIFSDTCHTEFKARYKDNEKVVVTLKDLVGEDKLARVHSCTFRVVVAPDVIKNSQEKMWPRTGQFYLEVTQPTWISLPAAADQVRASEAPESPRAIVKGSGEYLLSGCAPPVQGSFVDVLQLSFQRKTSCKYQLGIKGSDGKKYSWILLRNVYKQNTEVLPKSKITKDGKQICVEVSPEYTTFVSINNVWKNGYRVCSSEPGPWAVRVFTTKRNSYEMVR